MFDFFFENYFFVQKYSLFSSKIFQNLGKYCIFRRNLREFHRNLREFQENVSFFEEK